MRSYLLSYLFLKLLTVGKTLNKSRTKESSNFNSYAYLASNSLIEYVELMNVTVDRHLSYQAVIISVEYDCHDMYIH